MTKRFQGLQHVYVLSSYFLYVIMVIESCIMIMDVKLLHKNLNNVLNQNVTLLPKNEQGLYQLACVSETILLTEVVEIEHNQNMIAAIDHQGAIWINDHS